MFVIYDLHTVFIYYSNSHVVYYILVICQSYANKNTTYVHTC